MSNTELLHSAIVVTLYCEDWFRKHQMPIRTPANCCSFTVLFVAMTALEAVKCMCVF